MGYRGTRIGEASNPGPTFTIATLNVTSLKPHLDYVCNIGGDALALQEVRLTKDGLNYLNDGIEEHGIFKPWWGNRSRSEWVLDAVSSTQNKEGSGCWCTETIWQRTLHAQGWTRNFTNLVGGFVPLSEWQGGANCYTSYQSMGIQVPMRVEQLCRKTRVFCSRSLMRQAH